MRAVEHEPGKKRVPVIFYEPVDFSYDLPISVLVNPEKLQDLLSFFKVPVSIQDSLRFHVTPFLIKTEDHLLPEDSEKKVLLGSANLLVDSKGERHVHIHTGSHMINYLRLMNAVRSYQRYASMYKHFFPTDSPRKRIEKDEEKIAKSFVSSRIFPYLEAANFDRGQEFVSRVVRRRIADSVSSIIVHEVSHIADSRRREELDKRGRLLKKRMKTSLISSGTLAVGGATSFLADASVLLDVLLFSSSGVSATAAGMYKLRRWVNEVETKSFSYQTEIKALYAEMDFAKDWRDLVEVLPSGIMHAKS